MTQPTVKTFVPTLELRIGRIEDQMAGLRRVYQKHVNATLTALEAGFENLQRELDSLRQAHEREIEAIKRASTLTPAERA